MNAKRRKILESSRELIEHLYVQSVSDGIDNPVVLVLDPQDNTARLIADGLTSPEEVTNRLKSGETKGVEPCLMRSLSQSAALENIAPLSSSGRQMIESAIQRECFAVAIISDGGVSWVQVPIPE